MEGARRKFAEEPPQRLRARCLCGAACPGESHCCSGSVGPPRRGHTDTLSHTGWHCHNPPAGVTGALLPAAKKKKTCPRYGACAKAFPSPGGVSRGGVRCSAGLRDAAGDGNPFCLQCGEILEQSKGRARRGPGESVAGANLRPLNRQLSQSVKAQKSAGLFTGITPAHPWADAPKQGSA